MALSFLFLLVRRAIELLGLRRLSTSNKDVEILVLRHQLEVKGATTSIRTVSWHSAPLSVIIGNGLLSRLVPVLERERLQHGEA